MNQDLLHITAYRFAYFALERLPEIKQQFLKHAQPFAIKGTILLSHEGMNINLSGERVAIEQYKKYLMDYTGFHDLHFKENVVDENPFRRMKVLIKKEIITLGVPDLNPSEHAGAYLTPQQLQQWYREGREMVVLDTRNDYEVALGKFANAVDLGIKSFRDLPQAVAEKFGDDMKQKTIVTYCTGGIRCEKVTAYMRKIGFEHVYQLQGGIIHYFEQCGSDFYNGQCFVFDDRIAIDSTRAKTDTQLCMYCQVPLTAENRAGKHCVNC